MYGQGNGITNWFCGSGAIMPGPMGMILIILIVIFVISLIQNGLRSRSASPPSLGQQGDIEALNILKRRYAEGDISIEEFEAFKMNLSK